MKKKIKYMVVDDDSTNNLICEFIIRKFEPGAEVAIFEKPEIGLSFIEQMRSSENEEKVVLFLDINMPTMSGWEFLDQFQQLNSSVVDKFEVYILSSSVEDFSREAVAYPFVRDFLSKPLSNQHLKKIQEKSVY